MSRGRDRAWLVSVRVATIYLILSALWIALSDEAVNRIAGSADEVTRIQTFKGWGWILTTSFLLYALIRQALRSSQAAADRFRAERTQLDLVLSQVPDIIFTTDTDLRFTSTRGRGLAVVGREPDAAVGQHISDRIDDPVMRERVEDSFRRALAGEESNYEFEFNEHLFETRVVPLKDSDLRPIGVLGYSRDVTFERSLATQLERSASDRDRLLKHLVRAEKDERDRIAAGIHDDSIQVMTAAAMALDLLLGRLEDERSRELAERARSSLGEAIKRLRNLVFELKPVELDRHGLAAALRQVLEQFRTRDGLVYEIDGGSIEGLSSHSRYSIFRVAREAIVNAYKHSNPSKIEVHLHQESDGVRVTVEDDGSGFDVSAVRDGKHFGLDEMKQRAELAGGWLRVTSQADGGTCVEFWMPLAEHAPAEEVVG